MPKAIHKLNVGDLISNDKMNYSSIPKLLNPAIEEWMLKSIPGSNATAAYLRMMRCVNDAFNDPTLSPLRRVYKMAYVCFAFRIWKWYCKLNKEKFKITANVYACVEMNFHELIKLINYFRKNNMHEYFMPTFFGSQDCEQFFRRLRSLTTLCSTIVNFSMLDLLNRIHRIDFMSYAESVLSHYGITSKESSKFCTTYKMPSEEEIEQTVMNAQIDAELLMAELGISATHPILALLPPLMKSSSRSNNNDEESCEQHIENIEDFVLDESLQHHSDFLEINDASPISDDPPPDLANELNSILGKNANTEEIKHLIKDSSKLYSF